MDPSALKKHEALLLELQSTLQSEIDESGEESAPVEVNGAMGRISRGDAMQVQQMALEMKRRREERLMRVESALSRINKGTYGLCSRCRKPIGEARLEAFPDAVCCVRCAS